MRNRIGIYSLGCLMWGALVAPASALERNGFALSVLVEGEARIEYPGRGRVYVEAVRDREYELTLTNPLPYRVAVALSVDGLNTIDARHTSAAAARKWVLQPYETVTISGWQVSANDARRFFFTGERGSYGAQLGQTDNLGVIEAAFFRERVRPWRDDVVMSQPEMQRREHERLGRVAPQPAASEASAAAGAERRKDEGRTLSDEYAATGIGDRRDHHVRAVQLDLESTPSAVLSLRYEYRPALVRLGLLPRRTPRATLDRRERASGFEGSFCPDPNRREW